MFKKIAIWCSLSLLLAACATNPTPPPAPTAVAIEPTPTLPMCNAELHNRIKQTSSILPPFEPRTACELENVSNQVSDCRLPGEGGQAYQLCQSEFVTEVLAGQGEDMLFIERHHQTSTGCWSGSSFDTYSVRVCQPSTGESMILTEWRRGPLIPSPDQTKLALFITEEQTIFDAHIYILSTNSAELMQLDTQPWPHGQNMGGSIVKWSEDGEWVEVSLWAGRAGEYFPYQIRTDGSGEFVALTPEPVE